MQHKHPDRINSAPPDEGQPSLRDTKTNFNIDAQAFVPKSVPQNFNPDVVDFEPSEAKGLSAAANEFKPDDNTQVITEESDDEGKVFVKNLELRDEDTLELSDTEISPLYKYTFREITQALETFLGQEDFSNLNPDLEALAKRSIEAVHRKKGHRKPTQPTRYQEPTWRQARMNEEKKISDKAKRRIELMKKDQAEQEKIKRRVKITLNKLSPNNLERLQTQLAGTAKESYINLHCLVSGIFEKAWAEPKYTKMYAQLCKNLKSQFHGYTFPEEETKETKTRNHFRYELLYMCEEAFTQKPKELQELLSGEQEYQQMLQKKKTHGTVQFIGELFNVRLISPKIILGCVYDLLGLPEDDSEVNVDSVVIDETQIEGACILLSTGGSSFEHPKLKQGTEVIFSLLANLIEQKRLPPKIRFKIMNVLDERKEGWAKSSAEQPKKIEDIHAEYVREKDEISKRAQDYRR